MSVRRLMLALAGSLALGGCSWFTDFRDQPKLEPWEAEMAGNTTTPFRGNPQMSVPIYGEAVPGFVISYSNSLATIDSFSAVPNPHPATPASLDNGRKYYQINCAVCHGVAGAGNGPALMYGVPAPSLLTPITVGRTDGYIYGMIRNGRNLMPTYDRIEEQDRWDVVNYVRSLQGKTGAPADTTPPGLPGQNGAAVPSFTMTAPTRPAPFNAATMPASGTAAPADTTTPGARPAPNATAPAAPAGPRPNGPRPNGARP